MINELYEHLFQMQSFFRYFITLLIISNFLVILFLHFKLRLDSKLKSMFNISNIKKEIKNIKTVLLIIAHPNDEIMYFTPTIKKLINLGITLKILCLSNGNNEKIDDIRTEEFKKVSKILKLEDNSILNIPELKDDINQFWNENIVSEKIDDFLKKNNDIQTILTFNEDGVTKHPNHISCFNGLVHFIKKNREKNKKKQINFFLLDSFNPVFKYTFFFPFITFFFREFGFFNYNFFTSYKFMSIYNSQFNWKRKLYVFFSGYSFFNSYEKIELQ